jgi:hypothetical protein
VSRSQKRRRRRAGYSRPGSGPEPRAATVPSAEPTRRRAARDEPPPAPWGSFPLVELAVLVALVMLIGGFVVQGTRGVVMIGVGVLIGSVAGLELSLREHFAGYRSHTMLLALTAAVITIALLTLIALQFFATIAIVIPLAIGAAVFALAFRSLRAAFRRASGGYSFRIGRMSG